MPLVSLRRTSPASGQGSSTEETPSTAPTDTTSESTSPTPVPVSKAPAPTPTPTPTPAPTPEGQAKPKLSQLSKRPVAPAVTTPAKSLTPTTPALAPALLVGEYFTAALISFVCGTVGLVFVAAELSVGAFIVPRVVGVVHLFTLGWIMLSIFGALCQFLPVAVDRSIWSVKLAHTSFVFQVLGIAGLVSALFINHRELLYVGAASLTLAFVSFGVNLGLTLWAAERREFTFWALAAATVSLIATPIYGVILAVFVHDGGLGDPFSFIAHHAHIAILGVVLTVMVGVAHRLMPMFLLTHGVAEKPAWVALGLLTSATATLMLHSVVGGGSTGVLVVLAEVFGVGGVAAMITQAVLFYRSRKRREIDPGMSLAAAGLVALATSAVLGPVALHRGIADMHLLTAYYTVLLGAITLFIAGHYYKIVPFLVWNHRYGPLLGKKKVPKVSELYSQGVAYTNAVIFALGLVTLVVGTWLGQKNVITVGAGALSLGAVLETVVIARITQKKVQ